MAMVIRAQLVVPENDVVAPGYVQPVLHHARHDDGLPGGHADISGFGNYLVPLMIGARDMAFPRLNAFGYWIFLFGGLLLYFSYSAAKGSSGTARRPTSDGLPTRR